jgi:hypothetical protein
LNTFFKPVTFNAGSVAYPAIAPTFAEPVPEKFGGICTGVIGTGLPL